jgi:cytochrome c oxidase assembly protein subunit 15
MYSKAEKRFLRINLVSIISLFLLILAGGVVRSSGSGMGCPDWPKCFDQYIPPTNISQLPLGYQEKFVAQRLAKNERFAKLLDKTGYSELAFKIRNDEFIKLPEEFNASKTYVEYINRLIGALTGIFLVLTFVFSIKLYLNSKRLFWLSGINLILVLFQAWLGSIVVSTNLVAWIITIHMLVAILILAISIYTYQHLVQLRNEIRLTKEFNTLIKLVSLLAIIVSVIQITIGTEVREEIDAVQMMFKELDRGEWLSEVGRIFTYHKDLAILATLINAFLFILIIKYVKQNLILKFTYYIIAFLILQIVTGVALSYFALPPWAQALHILLATLLFSTQFYLYLILTSAKHKPIRS